MTEDELEKFASASHDEMDEKVKESLDTIFSIYIQLVEAETGLSFDEIDLNDINEGKTLQIETPKGKSLNKAPIDKNTNVGKIKSYKDKQSKIEIKDPKNSQVTKEEKNEIPMPPIGKKLNSSESQKNTFSEGTDQKNGPFHDNKKVEKDESWETPNPGIEKSNKTVMGNVYTPQLHKFPMSTNPKNERRVYDFKDFLKMINYKTHDSIVQKGNGQNL
jgi:hypothetical protein